MTRILLKGAVALAFTAVALGAASVAGAQNCAGFIDVPVASAFCPSVEWMRNRGVTTGCTGSAFCPNDPVIRLSMAAFMKRLGDALTPVQLRYDGMPGTVDLDAGVVACQTDDYVAANFPRRAFADASFTATAPGDVGVSVDLVVRFNGGTWLPLNGNVNKVSLDANQWGALADLGHIDMAAGDTVRFGLLLGRGGLPGTASLADSRCQLRVLVYSRTGAASPY